MADSLSTPTPGTAPSSTPSTIRKIGIDALANIEKLQDEVTSDLPRLSHQGAQEDGFDDEKGSAVESDGDFEVKFDASDPENPYNWPSWKKWAVTILSGVLVLNACVSLVFSIMSTVY